MLEAYDARLRTIDGTIYIAVDDLLIVIEAFRSGLEDAGEYQDAIAEGFKVLADAIAEAVAR
jgi:hypothetical protein